MRSIRRWAAVLLLGAATGPAGLAQTAATGTGTTGTSTGASSTGGVSSSTSTSTGAGGTSSSSTTTTQTPTISGAMITGSGTTTPTPASTGVDASNVFGAYYANPYYQGRAGAYSGTATTASTPGGFADPLYGTTGGPSGSPGTQTGTGTGTTGSTTSSSTGFAGIGTTSGGTGGRTGTTGGRTGTGSGLGSTGTSANGIAGINSNTLPASVGGPVVALPRAIAFTATLRFPTPVRTPAGMETDLRGVLDRSTMLSDSRGVDVRAEAPGLVVLRGAVRDEDEARLAENMVRLSPGVRDVRNELRFPAAAP